MDGVTKNSAATQLSTAKQRAVQYNKQNTLTKTAGAQYNKAEKYRRNTAQPENTGNKFRVTSLKHQR